MYPSPSKNSGDNRDLRKGAISPEEMADIIRKLEEAKLHEKKHTRKQNSQKQTLVSQAPGSSSNKLPSKVDSHPTQDGNSYLGPPPPAPTRSTFMFFME